MDFLLEMPWWMTLAGLGAAVAVWIYGNNRLDKNYKLAGIGLLLLTVLLTIVSRAIDTPREQGVRRTHAIVASANAEDWNKFQSLLDSVTQVGNLQGPADLRRVVEAGWRNGGFKSARIISTQATRSGSLVTVYVTILSEGVYTGRSEWQFNYEQRREGLVLASAKATAMDGGSGNAQMIMRYFTR